MHLLTILDMVSASMPDRVLLGTLESGLTGSRLAELSAGVGADVQASESTCVAYLGGNNPAMAVALFAAATAGVPFLPLNYRLGDSDLTSIMGRHDRLFVVTDTSDRARRLAPLAQIRSLDDVLSCLSRTPATLPEVSDSEGDGVAVLLMTSGTTSAPKSAVIRHRHLTSYLLETCEFGGAEESAATLVSVPPYHIAGVANLLSNLFTGRRVVYLDKFDPAGWIELVSEEEVSHAMVVPTMLARIVNHLEDGATKPPVTLTSLAYGGSKIAPSVIERALDLFPDTGFVNAYGLTETTSSIAVLGPEDHRIAASSTDERVRARLGSVGKPLPHVTIEIHDIDGRVLGPGEEGFIMVRGSQVGGEYLESVDVQRESTLFATRDLGYFDDEGYLFVIGRADDTIIRGGENIAPAEIEEVLISHPAVLDCAVAGIPDEEWGQRIASFVVLKSPGQVDAEELKEFVRNRLRGSKTPDVVEFLEVLPQTATGKILRRALVSDFVNSPTSTAT